MNGSMLVCIAGGGCTSLFAAATPSTAFSAFISFSKLSLATKYSSLGTALVPLKFVRLAISCGVSPPIMLSLEYFIAVSPTIIGE